MIADGKKERKEGETGNRSKSKGRGLRAKG